MIVDIFLGSLGKCFAFRLCLFAFLEKFVFVLASDLLFELFGKCGFAIACCVTFCSITSFLVTRFSILGLECCLRRL